uniref:Fibronectin type-III domain-containing protein n=1 Tax=Oncorhynchus tshawytscha TaxID=74940 RepID=A0A8C8HZE6_ONCTS
FPNVGHIIKITRLPQPQNLTLLTLNTQYVLTWDWDQTTTVYFGLICSSPCLASLGPPSRVELAPVGNLLDVTISDPLTSTQHSMKEHVLFLYYRILYWSRSDDPQGLKPKVLDSSNNLVTLPELEAWTWYCVMIQSRYDYYNKTSSYTEPQCMQTEGDTPYGQIFLYFLVSMMVCFLLVLLPSYTLFRFYRVLKNTFYPSIQLPVHIQEYLCDSSPGSDMPRLLTADSEAELCCDKLTICPEVVLLEIHVPPPLTAPPSELEQDSDRHICQDSRDSGICSTEGGSTQQGCSCGEPIRTDQELYVYYVPSTPESRLEGPVEIEGREAVKIRDGDDLCESGRRVYSLTRHLGICSCRGRV